MLHKTVELINVKADEAGNFTALASVFGNVDSQGDRMVKGAFRKSLARWRRSKDPIPIILSHQWNDPMALIGKADPRAVMETDEGLLVQGSLDLENPVARQVRKLMMERLLKGWSFGYTVAAGGQRTAEDGANEVTEVDLIEAGPTLKGANDQARLQEIKSAIHELDYSGQDPEEDSEEAQEGAQEAEQIPEEVEVPASAAALRQASRSLALELATDGLPPAEPPEPTEVKVSVVLRGPDAVEKLRRIKEIANELPPEDPPEEDPEEDESTEQIEDGQDEEPVASAKSPQDPLRTASRAYALEVLSDGLSRRKYEPEEPEPEPDVPSEDAQRRRFCDLYI